MAVTTPEISQPEALNDAPPTPKPTRPWYFTKENAREKGAKGHAALRAKRKAAKILFQQAIAKATDLDRLSPEDKDAQERLALVRSSAFSLSQRLAGESAKPNSSPKLLEDLARALSRIRILAKELERDVRSSGGERDDKHPAAGTAKKSKQGLAIARKPTEDRKPEAGKEEEAGPKESLSGNETVGAGGEGEGTRGSDTH